ncbi:helix-turn-helix domain-containing protein, partial [Rhizobium hidalgonense]
AWQDKDASKQHDNFVKLCGGTISVTEIAKQEKRLSKSAGKASKNTDSKDTLEQTLVLYNQGMAIDEIALERQLTQATIINHLEKLDKQADSKIDLERIKPDAGQIKAVRKAFRKIKKQALPEHFNEDGSIRLRALVEAL